jgi:ERCC4-related helicase
MAAPPSFVEMPLIRKDIIEYREYQVRLSEIAASESTMIVLSTGLGKTVIAALTAAKRLFEHPGSKVLFLAPSRPLADQQARTLRQMLDIEEDSVICMTGQDPPEQRRTEWSRVRIAVMTPQALQNDLVQQSYTLDNVSLLVYDEAHRGVGNYAYTFIAELYEKQANNPRSLGLTASPGHDAEHVRKVCENLRLRHLEVRSENSPDVRDYVVAIDM